jgi:hypothetical protein
MGAPGVQALGKRRSNAASRIATMVMSVSSPL